MMVESRVTLTCNKDGCGQALMIIHAPEAVTVSLGTAVVNLPIPLGLHFPQAAMRLKLFCEKCEEWRLFDSNDLGLQQHSGGA